VDKKSPLNEGDFLLAFSILNLESVPLALNCLKLHLQTLRLLADSWNLKQNENRLMATGLKLPIQMIFQGLQLP
jgi:hypothetical protein